MLTKKSRSIEDRNKIVEKYLYIKYTFVRKYLNRGVDYDDLYQVGLYGSGFGGGKI